MTPLDCCGIFQLNYNQFLTWQQALRFVAGIKAAQQKIQIPPLQQSSEEKEPFSTEGNLILKNENILRGGHRQTCWPYFY